MRLISTTLSRLRIGAPASFRNLHMYPLYTAAAGAFYYINVDRAMLAGDVEFTEQTERGDEQRIELKNFSSQAVFVLDGQELVGAMQDRVLNISVLAAGMRSTVLPVSCVEAARWEPASTRFELAPQLHFASGRAQRMAQVTDSMIADGVADSDQVDVWSAIEERAAMLDVHSDTRAHSCLFLRHNGRIARYAAAISQREGQSGAVYAIGARIVGMDLFDHPGTLADCLPKIVRSVALDALVSGSGRAPSREDAAAFVRRVAQARTQRFPGVGLGDDIRLCGPDLAGGALFHSGRLIHLSAFDLAACA